MKTTALIWQVFENINLKGFIFKNLYLRKFLLYGTCFGQILPNSSSLDMSIVEFIDDDKLLNYVDADKTGSLNGFA